MHDGFSRAVFSASGQPFASMPETTLGFPSTPVPPWAGLLEQFYARSGLPFPQLHRLPDIRLPEPYQRLLAHSADMTPTLEKFYGHTVGIRVLNFELHADSYLREVVLHAPGRGGSVNVLPVEYGVIRIFLDRLSAPARRRVLEQECPFGTILREENIVHSSWPQDFFRIEADARLAGLLRTGEGAALYGRRNLLRDDGRHVLAEVIEILAPAGPDDISQSFNALTS
jgi:chorismate-pyruvate lyase